MRRTMLIWTPVFRFTDRLCFVDPNKTRNLPAGLACVELALVMGGEVWFISWELSAKSVQVGYDMVANTACQLLQLCRHVNICSRN
jgi:hypothetical protein